MADSTPTRRSNPPSTARLSLGENSPAATTSNHLRFQLDHALARDAVHTPLDTALLQRGLTDRGLQPLLLHSAAPDRKTYLRRPDLGRTLQPESVVILSERSESKDPEATDPAPTAPNLPTPNPQAQPRILFLLADGLSALALERHGLPLLDATLPLFPTGVPGGRSLPAGVATPYSLLPILTNARVAIADQIGQILNAQITVLLIGERPGLSSPDSLGCYITWNPSLGRTDAERNCISNIRSPEGLSYTEAAHRIVHYIHEAQRLQTTGIALKDPKNVNGPAAWTLSSLSNSKDLSSLP